MEAYGCNLTSMNAKWTVAAFTNEYKIICTTLVKSRIFIDIMFYVKLLCTFVTFEMWYKNKDYC